MMEKSEISKNILKGLGFAVIIFLILIGLTMLTLSLLKN